jgi:hypothetical protein
VGVPYSQPPAAPDTLESRLTPGPAILFLIPLPYLERAIVENIEKAIRTTIKQDIVSKIDQTIGKAIKQAFSEQSKTKKKG